MQSVSAICNWCWRKLVVLVALTVILFALIFSVARLALPFLSDWKVEIENVIEKNIGYQTSIESINASWKDFYPRIHLVDIKAETDKGQLFSAGEVIFSIDIVRSILNFSVQLKKVTVINTYLNVLRTTDNQWYVNKQLLDTSSNKQKDKEFIVPKKLQGIILSALNSRLYFKDEIKKKNYFFDDLSLSAINQGKKYQLFVSSDLPSPLGKEFDIGFDIRGNINQLSSLKGQAYLNVNTIDIKKVLPWIQDLGPVKSGILSGQFWFDVGNKKQEFFAQLQAEEIKIDTKKIKDKRFSKIKAEFDRVNITGLFKKLDNNYQAYLPAIKFTDKDDEIVFSDNLLLSFSAVDESLSDIQQIKVSYDEVSLEAMQKITDFIPASSFKSNVKKINLLGSIRDGFISCDNIDNTVICEGKSYFEKINYSTSKTQPSLQGFSGEVFYRDNKLYANNNSSNIKITLPNYFIKPLQLDSLKVAIWADIQTGGVTVRNGQLSAKDAALTFDMDLDIKNNQGIIDKEKSRIRLLANSDGILATDAKYYLPLKKMHPNFERWFKQALQGGIIEKGKAVVDSSLAEHIDASQNVWQLEATVSSVDFKFNPDWPIVNNIEGNFIVNNNGLLINVLTADVLNMPLYSSYIWLDSYKNSVLKADLAGEGELSDLLKLVRRSPLAYGVENVLDNISLTGQQRTKADLEIPFSEERSSSVDIDIELNNADFHEKVADLHISAIPEGERIYISESAFATNNFSGFLNGYAADFSLATTPSLNKGITYTDFSMAAKLPAKEFWPDHTTALPYWFKDIKGKSDYAINLRLPINSKKVAKKQRLTNKQKYPSINIASNLVGAQVTFPDPIIKKSAKKINTNIDLLLLPDNKVNARFSIANLAKGSIDTIIDDELKIESANIVLQQNKLPVIEDAKGIYIQGHLERFNVDTWLEYIDAQPQNDEPNAVLDSIRTVDVKLQSLYYLDRDFGESKVTINQEFQNWLINIDNIAMNGQISLPKKNIVENGIEGRFDFIDWNKVPEVEESDDVLDPKTTPHIQLGIGRLEIKDFLFDNVVIQTSRALHGIKIDNIAINNPDLSIDMQGSWVNLPNGSSETSIKGTFVTENLGQGLHNIGYAKLIEDGFGKTDFSFHWPNSPIDLSLDNITGNATGKFEKGNILTIDPGAGRLFSLISLNQLPKRLILNFKDIESKGYYFRKMSGDFTFADGIANIDRFSMRSSIGKINVVGQADLVKQTYNQDLRFLPDLSSSLPVLGTLLGGGNTGLGLLVLDGVARIFGKQLDDIGERKYKITGSWDNPNIDPLDKPVEVKENNDVNDELDDGTF